MRCKNSGLSNNKPIYPNESNESVLWSKQLVSLARRRKSTEVCMHMYRNSGLWLSLHTALSNILTGTLFYKRSRFCLSLSNMCIKMSRFFTNRRIAKRKTKPDYFAMIMKLVWKPTTNRSALVSSSRSANASSVISNGKISWVHIKTARPALARSNKSWTKYISCLPVQIHYYRLGNTRSTSQNSKPLTWFCTKWDSCSTTDIHDILYFSCLEVQVSLEKGRQGRKGLRMCKLQM